MFRTYGLILFLAAVWILTFDGSLRGALSNLHNWAELGLQLEKGVMPDSTLDLE